MEESPEEFEARSLRGLRARRVREELLQLSRNAIAQKYHISISTLQSWEDVKLGGMAEIGARRLITVFKSEGIPISLEWLMYGTGASPFKDDPANLELDPARLSPEQIVAQELKLFHELNKDAVHAVIQDDSMAPWLMPGDYVAGKWHFGSEITKVIGQPCIVQKSGGQISVRIVTAGDKTGSYTLNGTNTHEPLQKNIELLSAAPIIWIRKLQPRGKF